MLFKENIEFCSECSHHIVNIKFALIDAFEEILRKIPFSIQNKTKKSVLNVLRDVQLYVQSLLKQVVENTNNKRENVNSPQEIEHFDIVFDGSSLLSELPVKQRCIEANVNHPNGSDVKIEIKQEETSHHYYNDSHIHLPDEKVSSHTLIISSNEHYLSDFKIQTSTNNEGISEDANEKTEYPFKCTICPSTFRLKYLANRHRRQAHGPQPRTKSERQKKIFICDICSSKKYSMKSLERHIRVHTGESPFQCDICSNTYKDKQSMKYHLATHVDDRPFKCTECSKTFKFKNSLRVHRHSHTGYKPQKCPICQRNFPISVSMQIHMRSHTGEKPAFCPVCNKGFQRRVHVRRHVRRMHNLDPNEVYKPTRIGRRILPVIDT